MPYRQAGATGDLVFVTFNGAVHALELESGRELWRYASPDVISVPTMRSANGCVFVHAGTELAALDARTGKVHWRAAVPVEAARGGRVDAHGAMVVVSSAGSVYAFAQGDGSLRWSARATSVAFGP